MWSCAFRRGRQSMSSQDIADRLSGNLIPQIGQGADNPSIAPVPVLAGHAHDQLLELALDPRSAQTSTPLEPSNLRATSLRYQARMVSGFATVATSARSLRPKR